MKRILEIIFSILVIMVFLPIGLVVGLIIWQTAGLPVFYFHERPGLNGKPFYLIKFRTMTEARNVKGDLLPGKDRLTKFGKFLRSTSLDELPQLYNVLKGEMSLVGPRPLRMEYLGLYSTEQMRRHEVKPGITGWAQVNGRNLISWEENFELDVWYVDNRSWWLDLKILWLTFEKVLSREGESSATNSLRPRFNGDN